jgi:hypothetical protein
MALTKRTRWGSRGSRSKRPAEIRSWAVSQTKPMALTKRTHWQTRENASSNRATSPENRSSQTNPLARSDVLSSEKCRCSERVGFPRTKPIGDQGGCSPNETKPMPRSPKRTHWQARENGSHKRATSPVNRFDQTNPLIRYDVLSAEKCRCPGRVGFPRTNRHALGRVTRSHENGRGTDCMIAVVWPPVFRASQWGWRGAVSPNEANTSFDAL